MNIFNSNSLQDIAPLAGSKSFELSAIIILMNVILILAT